MKKRLVLLTLLLSLTGFSQSIKNYKYVIIPLKFDFLKSDNQYRLATLSKFNLTKGGFVAFYDNEQLPDESVQRCDLLSFDVVKEKAFLATKMHVVFKDCYGKIVYQSESGMSKEKEYDVAYTEALNRAFLSIYALNYQYKSGGNSIDKKVYNSVVSDIEVAIDPVSKSEQMLPPATNVALVEATSFLYAQPISNGFQFVDTTPKVVMKVYKTSNISCFIAEKDALIGVLVSKNGQWFFEYYRDNMLFSEKMAIKF